MTRLLALFACVLFSLCATPAWAQLTVLDQAQDVVSDPAAPPPPCGTQTLNIARMSWPSAELLAEIHARILAREYRCDARVIPGDLAATASAMGSTGQPAVAPEMWITRIAEVWNAGVERQQMRQTAPTFGEGQLEGWFIPAEIAAAHPELTAASGLAEALPSIQPEGRTRFISCPPDWACALINRNLIRAHGLENLLEIVEPANRFEMDTLIAEAMSRNEPVVFYYWRPNAILAQFEFRPLDMGAYDEEAAKCLARLVCEAPKPSAFPSEPVVIALSEWVFSEAPVVASYFGRASMPLAEMDRLLAQLNEPGASVEGIADRFVAQKRDLWGPWLGAIAP
ncbi:glycine betaine ABC transporter substrate-binding protein [Devosia submarina]|uniref:glycine betaine ABC transporter substrate-binding protein n=1 Tax=Devosia submarina TaxID=1173082 RepID=UPI000D3AECB5|nr:glycine betaine ABC transporter substrate-binding protein [Devosia submarina]